LGYNVRSALRLGLTGGIGSGKSTVAQLLADLGAGVIDADAISRAATAAGGAAIPLIQSQFGPFFVCSDGALDRERMRHHIFADPKAKAMLEGIIHPLVGQQIAAQAKALVDAGTTCLVFDIPLLVESAHWRKSLQRVLVIDCYPATQVSRVVARSGLSAADVETIISAQASRARRLAAADLVISNDGISLQELAAQVAQIGQQFGL
jgi:dephospho-CoA kinase